MADFTSEIHGFRHSFPFLNIDPNLEPINQFSESIITDHSSNLNNFHNPLPFSSDNFYTQNHQAVLAAEFPGNLAENFPSIFHQTNHPYNNVMPVSSHQFISSTTGTDQSSERILESKKRKAVELASETSSLNSSPQISETDIIGNGKDKNNSRRSGKRSKSNYKKDDEKPKEVVHVRARRGQATDSHSLAERVRRGKINERLRCLQDIVPGCYKTMGMAVMLDEIINYVQSLQNQVEFLSMKLTAASTFYDFNSETDAIEIMQRAKAQEAKEIDRAMKGEYNGGLTNFHQTWSL